MLRLAALLGAVTCFRPKIQPALSGTNEKTQYPEETQYPVAWAWDSLRTMSFLHAGDVRKHPLEWEKKNYDQVPLAAEDSKLIAFGKRQFRLSYDPLKVEKRQVKAARIFHKNRQNPSFAVLINFNSIVAFDEYKLRGQIRNELGGKENITWKLQNKTGEVLRFKKYPLWDVSNEKVREFMINKIMDQLDEKISRSNSDPLFNGVVLDSADWALNVQRSKEGCKKCYKKWDDETVNKTVQGQQDLLSELTEKVRLRPQQNLVLAKFSGLGLSGSNATMLEDVFCANYLNNTVFDWESCLRQMQLIREAADNGWLTQSHGMGNVSSEADKTFNMACFLMAAGKYSYYSYVDQAVPWAWIGVQRLPDNPLGPPCKNVSKEDLDPATAVTPLTRRFKFGTEVTINSMVNREATIVWAQTGSVEQDC